MISVVHTDPELFSESVIVCLGSGSGNNERADNLKFYF